MTRHLMLPLVLLLLATLVPAQTASAQRQQKLEIGDVVPAIEVEWVHGKADSFSEGRTYAIVSGNPREIMNATDIRETVNSFVKPYNVLFQMELVLIIRGDEDTIDDAERFVRTLSADVRRYFSLGVDTDDKFKRTWEEALNVSNRPWAGFFIGPDKRLLYTTTTASGGLAQIPNIDSMAEGRYDPRLFRAAEPTMRAMETARKTRNWRTYDQYLERLLEENKRVFALRTIERFETVLVDRDDRAGAYAYATTLREEHANDPTMLLSLARFIAESRALTDEHRDYEFAMATAKQAQESMSPSDPRPLSVQGLIAFRSGDIRLAERMARQAFRVADSALKPQYKRELDEYVKVRREQEAAAGIRR